MMVSRCGWLGVRIVILVIEWKECVCIIVVSVLLVLLVLWMKLVWWIWFFSEMLRR